MAKIKRVEENMYRFHCPGCGCSHVFTCNGRTYPNKDHSSWTFDMNMDRPTISPSLNIAYGEPVTERCHSIVSGGRISFCGDCTHHLANQTVDLPDIE